MDVDVMKILNLYAGIGGNRKLWEGHEVTAIENVPEIAFTYRQMFPHDNCIIADAHQYLLEHYKEYDFIWSSPPCPTHSVVNSFLNAQGVIRYPDMGLWQEIIFLKHFFKGRWVVENVKSYYEPIYKPTLIDRHYFWSNFDITPLEVRRDFNVARARASTRISNEDYGKALEDFHDIHLPANVKNARKLLRNAVYPPLGLHILNCSIDKPLL